MLSYFDPSVLVAFYCPEPLSDQVEMLILAHPKVTLSDLVEVELVSAVARKVRGGGLSREDANRILSRFAHHLDGGYYNRTHLSEAHYHQARWVLAGFNSALRTLDALHVAAALIGGFTLVTADKVLAREAKNLGVDTRFLTASE